MAEEIKLIKERLDVAEVISEYLPLKKMGNHFKGLCPFHQERTPSLVVSPDKGIWHCFGCQEGGDVLSFVQKIEGLDFLGTLKLLAARAGVELKKKSSEVGRPSSDRRARLLEIVDWSARLYQQLLVGHEIGEKALSYLKERGVQEETRQTFQLGYAPQRWNTLQEFLQKKGFRPEEMRAAGVVGEAKNGRGYDRFRGRIIFPIADSQGRLVALAGRIAPWLATGEEGKYVNSPETELYRKREVVYNLHRAKQAIRAAGVGIVVEGYMDVIMMVQAGVPAVVASSGTAFTEEQIKQLRRFTRTLHFAFDADAAGWRAGVAATKAALGAEMRVATLQFPAGMDPAEVAKQDADELKRLVAQPESLIVVALRQLTVTSAQEVEQHVAEVLPLLRAVSNPVQQGEMIREVAAVLALPESRVVDLVSKQAELKRASGEEEEEKQIITPEQRLLGLLIAAPSVRKLIWQELPDEGWFDEGARGLYKVLRDVAERNQDNFLTMSQDELVSNLSQEYVVPAATLAGVSSGEVETMAMEAGVEAKALARWLKKRWLGRQRDLLQRQLATAGEEDKNKYLQAFQTVLKQLAEVG
jgi:DNA primase